MGVGEGGFFRVRVVVVVVGFGLGVLVLAGRSRSIVSFSGLVGGMVGGGDVGLLGSRGRCKPDFGLGLVREVG